MAVAGDEQKIEFGVVERAIELEPHDMAAA